MGTWKEGHQPQMAASTSVYAQATALLSQLAPEDIVGDDAPEVVALREAGIKLFTKAVLHARCA